MNKKGKTRKIMVPLFCFGAICPGSISAREIYTFEDANLSIIGATTDTQIGCIFAAGDLNGDSGESDIFHFSLT